MYIPNSWWHSEFHKKTIVANGRVVISDIPDGAVGAISRRALWDNEAVVRDCEVVIHGQYYLILAREYARDAIWITPKTRRGLWRLMRYRTWSFFVHMGYTTIYYANRVGLAKTEEACVMHWSDIHILRWLFKRGNK